MRATVVVAAGLEVGWVVASRGRKANGEHKLQSGHQRY